MTLTKKKKIHIFLSIVFFFFFIAIIIWLCIPITLTYDDISNDFSVEINDNYLYIICDYYISNVDYLAQNNGTVYLCQAGDGEGRCYKQSIQVTTTRWYQLFKSQKTTIYKRELGEFGAISGESNIINDNGTITIVNRYDTEIYYRDSIGNEFLIWKFE